MAGGVLTNPITKERFVRLPAPPDRLRIEVQAPPDMVRPPLHLHRHSAESFQILDGRATLLVDGVERVLRQAIRWRPRPAHHIHGGTRAMVRSDS